MYAVISLLIVIIIFMSISKGITAFISAPSVALVFYAFGVGLQGVPLFCRPTGIDWVRGACRNGSYRWKAVAKEGECRRQREPSGFPKRRTFKFDKELLKVNKLK